jgi:hypothetical protein
MLQRSLFISQARLLAACGLLALAACGGGGGDDGPGIPPEAARVVITDANAPRVSIEAIQSVQLNSDSGSIATSDSSATATANRAVRSVLARTVGRAAPLRARPLATVQAVEACSGGGTVSDEGTLAQAGDSVTLTFNNCTEDGATLNGSLRFTLVSFNDAGTVFTVDVVLTNLRATTGNVVERLDGSMRMSIDNSNPAQDIVTLSTPFIATERVVAGQVRASRSLRELTMQEVLDNATGNLTTTSAFVASGNFPELGDVSFRVQTVQALVTPVQEVHPTSGVLRVTGANNTSALLTIGPDTVQVDVDNNGDGTTDTTLTLTWDEILADL